MPRHSGGGGAIGCCLASLAEKEDNINRDTVWRMKPEPEPSMHPNEDSNLEGRVQQKIVTLAQELLAKMKWAKIPSPHSLPTIPER